MARTSYRSPSVLPTTELDAPDTPSAVKPESTEPSTVTDVEWRAMQTVLNNVYAYRDAEYVHMI